MESYKKKYLKYKKKYLDIKKKSGGSKLLEALNAESGGWNKYNVQPSYDGEDKKLNTVFRRVMPQKQCVKNQGQKKKEAQLIKEELINLYSQRESIKTDLNNLANERDTSDLALELKKELQQKYNKQLFDVMGKIVKIERDWFGIYSVNRIPDTTDTSCTVTYLNEAQKEDYLLKMENNLFYTNFHRMHLKQYLHSYPALPQKITSKINPLLKVSNEGFIFVLKNTDIYTTTIHATGLFHHSSFLAGSNVDCAGKMKVENGVIIEMSNESGHYHPKLECVIRMLTTHKYFKQKFIKLKHVPAQHSLQERQMINRFNQDVSRRKDIEMAKPKYAAFIGFADAYKTDFTVGDLEKIRDTVLLFPPIKSSSVPIEDIFNGKQILTTEPGYVKYGKYDVYIPKVLMDKYKEYMKTSTPDLFSRGAAFASRTKISPILAYMDMYIEVHYQ